MTAWIISTDMDGTLLNHDDYSWQAAKPCLEFLAEQNIPVILNTSKTYAEVSDWVDALGISHPFITENGSAIYYPEDYFDAMNLQQADLEVEQRDGYNCIRLGKALTELLAFKQQHLSETETLVECSLERAIEMTGLGEQEASAAQQRHYTLPLYIEGELDVSSLSKVLADAGLQILKGGRFAHLMGLCDKGKAVQLLATLYKQQKGQDHAIIALGDSGNDIAMLRKADRSVIIKNHLGSWLDLTSDNIYKTQQQAPEGWVEGVVHILADEYKEIRRLVHG